MRVRERGRAAYIASVSGEMSDRWGVAVYPGRNGYTLNPVGYSMAVERAYQGLASPLWPITKPSQLGSTHQLTPTPLSLIARPNQQYARMHSLIVGADEKFI